MSKRKPRTFREEKLVHIELPQLTAEAMVEIARRIHVKEMLWRLALGIPRGIRIPDKPLPNTMPEIEAELAAVTKEEGEVTDARIRAPIGQEAEALGFHMLALRNRRWKLLELKENRGLRGSMRWLRLRGMWSGRRWR